MSDNSCGGIKLNNATNRRIKDGGFWFAGPLKHTIHKPQLKNS